MTILLRLLKEFWLPALLATSWTIYNLRGLQNWDIKTVLNIFGPTFFLASWATGQFFRVKKQAHVERNLSSIETRVENVVNKLEEHTRDFIDYSTGSDSIVSFIPMFFSPTVLSLGLLNQSTYPVFDIEAEVVDIDEQIDKIRCKGFTRQRFELESLYPGRLLESAYLFDLTNKDKFNINVFIYTRPQKVTQQFRLALTPDGFVVARKTTFGNKTLELQVPDSFPGLDPANPNALF